MGHEIYVGNLSADVSKQKLRELFSPLGDVHNVWINHEHKTVTYAFVKFADENTCDEACERFNNYELHSFKLIVKKSSKVVNQKGILIDLPKKTGVSKRHTLKKILVKNLRDNPKMRENFETAMQETEHLTDTNKCEVVKHCGEKCNLETLEETVIRNYKKPRQNKAIPVDIDLSKGKLLSLEKYNSLFNLQFTPTETTQQQQQQQQQQPQQQQTVRKKIPFELDYRSVCE